MRPVQDPRPDVASPVTAPSPAAPGASTPPPGSASTASIGEVVDYVKTYARQETLGPIKGAGRWIGFGLAGAMLLGLGLSLLLLGLLRLLQTEWDRSARGSLSWLAYLIVLVVCGLLLALTLSRIKRDTLNKEPD